MLKYKSLPQHIEAVFIQNILKIFAHLMQEYEVNEQYEAIISLCDAVIEKMNESLKSGELEVQERASTNLVILKIVHEEISASRLLKIVWFILRLVFSVEIQGKSTKLMDVDDPLGERERIDPCQTLATELLNLFNGELNPVAPKAQKKVPVPEG